MNEKEEKLEQEFESAKGRLARINGHTGAPQAESGYGKAFQALVKSGLRMQLKEKYRSK